jgi:hypothetical protein
MEHLGAAEIARSNLFCGPSKGFIKVFVLGFWDVGPWFYPLLGLVVRDIKVYIGRNVM